MTYPDFYEKYKHLPRREMSLKWAEVCSQLAAREIAYEEDKKAIRRIGADEEESE